MSPHRVSRGLASRWNWFQGRWGRFVRALGLWSPRRRPIRNVEPMSLERLEDRNAPSDTLAVILQNGWLNAPPADAFTPGQLVQFGNNDSFSSADPLAALSSTLPATTDLTRWLRRKTTQTCNLSRTTLLNPRPKVSIFSATG
jgi:hypothetical protein